MKKSILYIIALSISMLLLYGQTESYVVAYDDALIGEITASGDVFTQEKLTAAHENLPLGTQVEILNIQTGKRIMVTVNDRIENAPDLFWISKSAADTLKIYSIHPTEILYSVIGETTVKQMTQVYQELFVSLGPNMEFPLGNPWIPRILNENITSEGNTIYGVQVYSATKRMDAVVLSQRIQYFFDYLSYIEKTRINNVTLFRVIIGDFNTLEAARECYHKLHTDLPDIFLVEIH